MAQSRFASIEQAVQRRLARTLRPELIRRISEVLVFARLSPKAPRQIREQMVECEISRLATLGYESEVSPAVIEFLIRENFDPQLGARALRKAVELHLRGAVVNSLFGVGSPHGWVVCDSTFLKIEPIGPAA